MMLIPSSKGKKQASLTNSYSAPSLLHKAPRLSESPLLKLGPLGGRKGGIPPERPTDICIILRSNQKAKISRPLVKRRLSVYCLPEGNLPLKFFASCIIYRSLSLFNTNPLDFSPKIIRKKNNWKKDK